MNEEALLDRSFEERENIFSRYEKGREDVSDISPWEDPGYEIYHTTDRYGFIHDERLPKVADSNEARSLPIEMQRTKKWVKMLRMWDSADENVSRSKNINESSNEFGPTNEKLKRRIFKGIPNSLRSRVWHKLLNINRVKNENVGKYQEMLKLARQWSTDVRQIDSDVNRQFREHINYRQRYSLKQKSLFNVLCAYGMYNMEVGYCQGMSGLAGVLLMYMDEEEAFWALSILLKDSKYAMHGLYIEGFPKLTRFLEHHDKILVKFLPKLKRHFDQYGLDAILYSLKWFFVCFVERVPFSLCLRVWDIYLFLGEPVMTAMAFTILRMHKKTILRLNDMDQIVQFIQVQLLKDFGFPDDLTITNLENNMKELKKAKLDHPGPAPAHELPRRPLGYFVEPDITAKIGRRAEHFSETEKQVRANVVRRSERAALEVEEQPASQSDTVSGSKVEECGSVLESVLGGSRRSLALTSVTSTADLSNFSSNRSPVFGNSLDTHSIVSDSASIESGGCSLSIQKAPSTQSTPRVTPVFAHPILPSSDDVVRIHVTYHSAEEQSKSVAANGVLTESNHSLHYSKVPNSLALSSQNGGAPASGDNRIRIQVQSEELPTPLVDGGRIRPFAINESPDKLSDNTRIT